MSVKHLRLCNQARISLTLLDPTLPGAATAAHSTEDRL